MDAGSAVYDATGVNQRYLPLNVRIQFSELGLVTTIV